MPPKSTEARLSIGQAQARHARTGVDHEDRRAKALHMVATRDTELMNQRRDEGRDEQRATVGNLSDCDLIAVVRARGIDRVAWELTMPSKTVATRVLNIRKAEGRGGTKEAFPTWGATTCLTPQIRSSICRMRDFGFSLCNYLHHDWGANDSRVYQDGHPRAYSRTEPQSRSHESHQAPHEYPARQGYRQGSCDSRQALGLAHSG